MRLGAQTLDVSVLAVAVRHAEVVAHVVAGIEKGRIEDRVEPERCDAEVLQVRQSIDDPLQVTDAVTVRVAEALRIDLIEDRAR